MSIVEPLSRVQPASLCPLPSAKRDAIEIANGKENTQERKAQSVGRSQANHCHPCLDDSICPARVKKSWDSGRQVS